MLVGAPQLPDNWHGGAPIAAAVALMPPAERSGFPEPGLAARTGRLEGPAACVAYDIRLVAARWAGWARMVLTVSLVLWAPVVQLRLASGGSSVDDDALTAGLPTWKEPELRRACNRSAGLLHGARLVVAFMWHAASHSLGVGPQQRQAHFQVSQDHL